MLELERTFLARELPGDLKNYPAKKYLDLLFPIDSRHPHIRLRKRGDIMELTKKTLVDEANHSTFVEQTITLDPEEYQVLSQIPGKRTEKTRHFYPLAGKTAEIDVFEGNLSGLVLIDFEYDSEEEKHSFVAPDICLAEVTEEEAIAGGYLAGKSLEDILPVLEEYGYTPII